MFTKTAVIGFLTAVISFVAAPAHADGIFSKTSLTIGSEKFSINSSGTLLTKTNTQTRRQKGQQKFKSFSGMMWVPEHKVLFVAGVLEGSRDNKLKLYKIRATGGTGDNMFAVIPDGGSYPGYNYRLGSQSLDGVKSMRYSAARMTLEVDNGYGTVYRIKKVGGGGYNMFALDNNERGCNSVPGYDYLLDCRRY